MEGADASLNSRGLSLIPVLAAELEREPEEDQRVLDEFAAVATTEDARRRLLYLRGRLFERSGKMEEAARIFAELATDERFEPEPHERYVEVLRDRGEFEGAEQHLRETLNRSSAQRRLWELWTVVAFQDLQWTLDRVLAHLPTADSQYGQDLGWLLAELETRGVVRVNCGGPKYKSTDGIVWERDRFFDAGGHEWHTWLRAQIGGTEDDELYHRGRWFLGRGPDLPGYRIPVPPGRYRVTVHFAEIFPALKLAEERVFDVVIEKDTVARGYDVVKEVGYATADQRRFDVTVEDGMLDVLFRHHVRSPAVKALEVEWLE